ncbi:MAG: L-ectoine synthase [Dehalococcoidia bacterium]|nr:L-ectoine synthase [Dehalococcoidia bacterium]
MIVRSIEDILDTDREVDTPNWTSRRLLLAKDGCDFSMHDTMIRAGTETFMWYKHHVEAVYCVSGEGTVETVEDGTVHEVVDGTLYTLDGHEKHILRARTDMRMICVFTPPLTGRETHDEEGVYPLITDDPEAFEAETGISVKATAASAD